MGAIRAGAGLAGVVGQSSVPTIDGSVYFNSNGVLFREPQNNGNRNVWTVSWWSKLSGGKKGYQYMFSAGGGSTSTVGSGTFIIYQIDNGATTHFFYQYGGGAYQYSVDPTDQFSDCGSWYHHVIQFDSLSLTVKYWVNNREISTNGGYAYAPAALLNSAWNDGGTMQRIGDGTYGFKGQMTQWYSIDGLKLTPDDFAFTDPRTGIWRPKSYQTQISDIPVNNPNNNTTWSANVSATSGGFGSGEEATKGFDGSLTTKCKTNTNGAIINITFTNVFVEKLLRIRTNFTNGTGSTIKVNNVSYNLAPSNSDGQFVHIPGFTGAMTSIQLAPSGSVNASFSAIEVDGVILQDSTTTNNRTWDSSLLFGTNGFYLPMDGSAPVGTDMSGQGNHFRSENLGLGASPERATGALPLLNTAACPRATRPGNRGTDVSANYTITVNNPGSGNKYYFSNVLHPDLTLYEGGTYVFDYTAATTHPLYLSSLKDGKWNSKAYSVIFDGNGDRLEIADSNDFHLGADDFTIEAWVYLASHKNQGIVGCNNSPANAGWEFDVFSDGSLRFYSGNGGSYNSTSLGAQSPAGLVQLNEWTHVAAQRKVIPDSGGMSTLRLFKNGGLVAESTLFHTFADSSNGLDIGSDGISLNTAYHFHGYISNLRIVKGSTVYDDKGYEYPFFEPPTTTLTNVSNTVLLCCQDNNATTHVVSPSAISAVGGATANNSNPYVYTDNGKFGLNTGTSNVTKYTLPKNSNSTLYYFCNAHSGMGGDSVIKVIKDPSKADPAAFCLFASADLQKGGSNYEPYYWEDINVNFDSSVQIFEGGFPFPGNGLSRSTTSLLTNFYYSSTAFPGNSNDYFDVDNLPAIGMDDFTIEVWYRCTDTGYNTIFEYGSHTDTSSNKGFIVSLNSSGKIWARDTTSGSAIDISNASLSGTMTKTGLNKWNHVAIQRKGVVASLFVNGNLVGHGESNWESNYTSTKLRVGKAQYINGEVFTGNLSDLRFYKGVAKYDHELGFIPASSYPNILPDSPSGLSLPAQFDTPLSGSVSLDGGDHLSIPDSADYTFGSGDWCIECFVYANTTGTVGLIDKSDSGTFASSSFELRWNSGQVSFYYFDGSNRRFMQTGTSLISNMWTHLVAYRDGNRMKLFQDGLFCAHYDMSSVGAMNDTTNIVSIGGHGGNPSSGSHKLDGFISNVRIIKGSVPEEYRTTQSNSDQTRIFNPPTAPLTNVTNTVLLTCQSTTDVTAKVVGGTLTANGDPQPSTWNPFDIKDNTATGAPGNSCTIDQAHSRLGGYNPDQGDGGIVQENYGDGIGSIPVHTGKYYFEVDLLRVPSGGGQIYAGVLTGDYHDNERGWTQDEIAAVRDTGVNYGFSGLEGPSIGTYTEGDTLGFALDADNKVMYVSKNGRYAGGGPSSSSNTPSFRQMGGKEGIGFRGYVPIVSDGSNHDNIFRMNCGQMPFKYRAPEGYMAWNAANSRSDIRRCNRFCGVMTYTGNASANNSVNTGQIEFKPDLIIFKNRDAAEWPYWIDSVRGNTAVLSSYTASSSTEFSSATALASFDKGGFTVGANGSTNGSANMVAWCWKAGGKDGSNLYNIDDVGYATAADVKMNVGGLNADFYDNSQRWSDLVTGTLDTTFGNSSKTAPFQGTTGTDYPDGIRPVSGNYLSMNFGSTFANAKRIRVYGHASLDGYTYNGANENLKINGVAIPKGAWQQNGGAAGQSVVTLQLPDGLSTLEWGYSSGSQSTGYLYLQAIEVDGKRLVDDNVTLPNKPTIAPTACSVNTAAGFSIVTYTGNLTAETAIPHGLGKKPAFIIVKERNANSGWASFNHQRGPSKISYINLMDAEYTETGSTATWANRAPDEHVFYVGNNGASNDNNLIAYIWAEIPGLSKFGEYIGNSNTSGNNFDGPFINCGFRPYLVIYKKTTSSRQWFMNDSGRSVNNPMAATLRWNNNAAEDTSSWYTGNIEFYSNGFKIIRDTTNDDSNRNNEGYLYMAWAEDALSGQFGATSNAR
tara:strand:+ start:1261 stop:7248 length:5988 start_codon:yes stop_codon:yes gene_type:complete